LRNFGKLFLFHMLRIGFRLTPMTVAARDRLRQRFFDRHGNLLPTGPLGQSGNALWPERRPRLHSAGRAIGYVPRRDGELPTPMPATVVAFYLPQFHPIPENDAWWGEGFTEWHNVTRALPQFEGHAQPRLPAELGFYDLRRPDVMRRQMQLAREYGVGAFCSYFYWFAGKTLLEQPLQQWLADPTLDLPLCLCWANENWSRRWDGRANDILISQQHSPADDLAFIEHVSRYLTNARYLRVDGKPLLLVYRPGLLPEPKATAMRWREWCRTNGVGEIQLAYVQSFDRVDPRDIGFDAAIEFPPNNITLEPITANQQLINPAYRGDVYDWRKLASQCASQPDPNYPRYPGANASWDNEPRRSGRGRVFAHASPRGYRDWLRLAIVATRRRFPKQPMVFVNAWNEWAEGAVLEPDARLGYAYLQATRDALRPPRVADTRPCAVIHVWYPELLEELVVALRNSGFEWRIVITTTHEREKEVRERVAHLALEAEIDVFDNCGRDILPFLHVANRLLDEGVDVVLKLHAKRSIHRDDGDAWRNEALARLVSPARARLLLEAFAQDARLGMVGPEEHMPLLIDYLGANRELVQHYAIRAGLSTSPFLPTQRFIAGSMFWTRLDALRPLLDAHFGVWEFEEENGQIDGTGAHAIERLFGFTAESTGYCMFDAATVCGTSPTKPDLFRFAQRN
jgi:lipopolysaccharide biosynthesis protein